MEGTDVRVTGNATAHHCVLICLIAALKSSCTSLKFLLSQVSTVQVEHQGTSVTRLTGSSSRVPVMYVVLHSNEERSHTLLWSFLVLGLVREKVSHLRDRVDEVSSACLLTLCDGEHDPCSPRFPDIVM